MPDNTTSAKLRSRPRSKIFLTVEPDNPYVRLEVSPLAATDEIAAVISEKRGKAQKLARVKTKRGLSEEDEELLRLQRIEEEIGKPVARKRYDEKYPQNVLLTVQPSLTDQVWLRHRQAALISEWLAEELGPDQLVPSPSCLRLWAPKGFDEQLLKILSQFKNDERAGAEVPERAAPVAVETAALRPSIADLNQLLEEKQDV